jgi:HAD superfamily hydrolase (TIGR01549 family)
VVARKIGAALFDWDGTLCDSGAVHFAAFRASMAEFGIALTRERFRAIYTPAWYQMYEACGLPRASWDHADQCWLRHYGEHTADLLPGAAEAIRQLQAAGIRLGIVTGGNRERVVRELERPGLSAAFGPVVCYEDVVHKKPHPEGIERALAEMGGSCVACCYVGDTPEDILMGRDAGVVTVAVVTDYVDRPRLEAVNPDVLIESIGDLPRVLL